MRKQAQLCLQGLTANRCFEGLQPAEFTPLTVSQSVVGVGRYSLLILWLPGSVKRVAHVTKERFLDGVVAAAVSWFNWDLFGRCDLENPTFFTACWQRPA